MTIGAQMIQVHGLPSDTTPLADGAPGPTGALISYLDGTYGAQTYRLVYNSSGASLAAYKGVSFVSGSSVNVAQSAAEDDRTKVAGFPQNAIPDASWGWVLCQGDGLVQADAAVAANAPIVFESATAAGRVDDPALNTDARVRGVVGICHTAAAAAGDNFRARISLL